MERIFKAYSRKLLRDLMDIQSALESADNKKALELLQDLIDDTVSDIEDDSTDAEE